MGTLLVNISLLIQFFLLKWKNFVRCYPNICQGCFENLGHCHNVPARYLTVLPTQTIFYGSDITFLN
jgi:hypothetical protein